MRRIGEVDESHAARAADVLEAAGVACRVDGGEVWVFDEDRVEEGRRLLGEFAASPDDPRYAAASAKAAERREAELAEEIAHRKRQLKTRTRYDRPPAARFGQTLLIAGLAVAASLVTLFGSQRPDVVRALQVSEVARPGPSGWWLELPEVAGGEVWRLVTPIFPHGGVIHLVFNLMWLTSLGPLVEFRRGPFRYLLLVLGLAVISNLTQYVWAGPRFYGLSGVVSGLFGYAWVYGRRADEGMRLNRETSALMFIYLFAMAAVGPPGIANAAHLGGLAAGMAFGAFDAWLSARPRRPLAP